MKSTKKTTRRKKPKHETLDRRKYLREIATGRLKAMSERKPLPHAWLNNEAEARWVEAEVLRQTNILMAGEMKRQSDKLIKTGEGHQMLDVALRGWVNRTLKAQKAGLKLDDDQARLLAYMLTENGTTNDGRVKYMSQDAIAGILGCSKNAVSRREKALRKIESINELLIAKNITRTPRGRPFRSGTKRKKK